MRRLLVDQQVITTTRVEQITAPPLEPGKARLRLCSAALTANNVTYAASGFAIGYWKFFPSGLDGQGLLPVWGTGEVVESRAEDLPVGTRLYGFYPLAETQVLTPRRTRSGNIEDISPHRADLPAVYNRYQSLASEPSDMDHLRALLQPLLATSWLLADWLVDNDAFGAQQVIVGSASSKTGLGLCAFLADMADVEVIGLTSQRNAAFVRGLGHCDRVVTYDAVDSLPQVASVYVDMAGNAGVKQALHSHLEGHLKHSAAVGISHWDQFDPSAPLAGVKPQFFFAPAQIAKRKQDWGPGVVESRINAAWRQLAETASDWMEMRTHDGLAAAQAVYAELAKGQADPKVGHVITLEG